MAWVNVFGRQSMVLAWAYLCFLFIAVSGVAVGLDCGACGQKNVPTLAMYCPKCHGLLCQPENRVKASKTAALVVDIYYTGDRPERLPEYGKLFVNGKYCGNIPQKEKEARESRMNQDGRHGLGADYTAKYSLELRNLSDGVIEVMVEMRFKRLYGLGRSHRRIFFPRVGLKPDQKTCISHHFESARNFHLKPKESLASGTRPPVGENFTPELKMGTGAIELETPLF